MMKSSRTVTEGDTVVVVLMVKFKELLDYLLAFE